MADFIFNDLIFNAIGLGAICFALIGIGNLVGVLRKAVK